MAKQTARPTRRDNSIDFNKLRKRRQRAALARRLLVLSAVAAVLLGAVALNSYLVEEGFTVRLSDMVQGMGGSGYPVTLPGGMIRNVRGAGDHLAVLNDTNLYIYSPNGKQVGSFQRMSSNTVLLATPDRLLTYDEGAKRFVIHSRSKMLLEQDLDYGMIVATINDHGDYAIVTSANGFISEIKVYNKKFLSMGTFSFIEHIVHSVALSPKGAVMAAGWASTRDGVLYSSVRLYRLDIPQEEAKAVAERTTFELPDNLIVDMWFIDEEHIAILGDRSYTVIDSAGSLVNSYSFGERRLIASEHQGKTVLLQLEDPIERRQDVVVLDADLNERGVYSTESVVQDIALSPRRVYILEGDVIYTRDHHMQPTSQNPEFPVPHAGSITFAGDKLYYLTREEICQLPRQLEDSSSLSESSSEGESG